MGLGQYLRGMRSEPPRQPHVSCLGLGICRRYLGSNLVFSTSLMAHLSPCSQGKEGSDKISLQEKCGRVVCATAAAHCLLPVGPTGLSLSDTYVTIRQACPEAWGMPGIVFPCFSSLPVSSYSPSLRSYLCTERERSWRSFFLPWSFFFWMPGCTALVVWRPC